MIILGFLIMGLTGYLVYALINPEKFQEKGNINYAAKYFISES